MSPPLESFVKLLVLDRDASAQFYERLGFERVGTDGAHVHLRWSTNAHVFLVGVPKGVSVDTRRGWGVLLCFVAQERGVDALAATGVALGAPVQGPEAQPWHTKEVVITDPDGYRLAFVEPAAAGPAAPAPSSPLAK